MRIRKNNTKQEEMRENWNLLGGWVGERVHRELMASVDGNIRGDATIRGERDGDREMLVGKEPSYRGDFIHVIGGGTMGRRWGEKERERCMEG